MEKLKYLTFVVLLIFVVSDSYGQNQVIDCGTDNLIVTPASCEENTNNGLLAAPNSYLVFSLSVTGSGGTSDGSANISQLPSGTTYNDGNGQQSGTNFLVQRGDTYVVRVPTTDCGPVDFNLDMSTDTGSCDQLVTVALDRTPIPTMGQWGLIILSLLITCIGVLYVKKNIRVSSIG